MPRTYRKEAGETRQATKNVARPPLPHERDESIHGQGSPVHPVIKQAHDDIVSGKKDTDLHGTPGQDKPVK